MSVDKPLSADKQALLRMRLRGAQETPDIASHQVQRASGGPAPLSFAQFYIWASDQRVPGNPSNNLPMGFRLRGSLDAGLLEESFNAIVRRHEALRTTFDVRDGEPVQLIHADCRIKLALVDLTHLTPREREIELRALAATESVAAFDLARLPLVRITLYRLGSADHVLIVNLHHIIADGLSIRPLMDELDAHYQAALAGSTPRLPELGFQYADFADWQRRELSAGAYTDQSRYWRAHMAGQLRPLNLPFDRPRPPCRSFRGGSVYFSIASSLTDRLRALDTASGTSFFTVALAAFQLLLHRCSGSKDFLILTPVSIRTHSQASNLIGDFLNLVPLRCDLSGDPDFAELLRRSRDTALNALSNRDLPFEEIADGIRMVRVSGKDPVFQSLLQVLPATDARLSGLHVEQFWIDYGFSQFDLSLHLYEQSGGYLGRFEYSTELFDAATVEKLASSFTKLLEACADEPKRPVAAFAYAGPVARRSPSPDPPVGRLGQVAPQGFLQKQIAQVWQDVLQVDQVGISENFFDLGGHSLLVAKTCQRLRQELKRDLKVVDLFAHPTVEALAAYLGGEAVADASGEEARARVSRRLRATGSQEPIAIIGMSGRFPGARDTETFWANLRAGRESITHFSVDELCEAGVPPEVARDPNYVPAMGYLEDADKFDASFFGYSARDAEIIDPQDRLLLQCAAETLERAGYDPERYAGLIGVYAGQLMNSYLASFRAQHVPLGTAGWLSTALASGGDFLTTRISYKLSLRGPSVNVQTACSTSLVAVHQACRALWDFECDMALAGGVSLILPLKSGQMYMQEGIYSPDGRCRVFDAGANGTVSGNGVGLVLLKRLSEAISDGDHIHAVIRGTAINNDGSAKAGYTAPSVDGQAQVIALALASAQCDANTIGYVEAHGTGTLLGDPIEFAALAKVFGNGSGRVVRCRVGSVKANIGHLYAAAGVAGLIKAALSLEHKELVPIPNFATPNPQIDFAKSAFEVSERLQHWEAVAGTPRRAGVSSFGFGGTNVHAVLEEAPAAQASRDAQEWQLLCLAAKSEAALSRSASNLARHLQEHPEILLADAAYTLQVGRREFSHRCIVACRNAAEASAALLGAASQYVARGVCKGGKRSVHFMFTGQGAQYPGMGHGLYKTWRVFRDAVDFASAHLKARLGMDLREVLFPADEARAEAENRLKRTEFTQPALFVTEYALARLWQSIGVHPNGMIGHSVGEYVAACLAEVMSFRDALDLVAERGRLMGQLPAGAMLAVPLESDKVRTMLGARLSIAGVNTPQLCVVSGPVEDVTGLEARLLGLGLAPRRLHTSHAFHSGMMDPILEPFRQAVGRIALKPPRLPYVSNVSGDWITPEMATDPDYYAAHLRNAVQFSSGVERLLADPGAVLLEVGPGNTLSSLAKRHPARTADHAVVSSMRHPDESQPDEAVFASSAGRLWLAGVRPDWLAMHGGQRRRVHLPTYPFEQARYWLEPGPRAQGVQRLPRERAERIADDSQWTYTPSWKRAPVPHADPAKLSARWLIFADPQGLGSRVAQHLGAGGASVVTVAAEERFRKIGPNAYAFDPAAPQHYQRLLMEMKGDSFVPDYIAHLWSVRATGAARGDDGFSETRRDLGFYSLVHLLKALHACKLQGSLGLALVTSDVHDIVGNERICPENAMALAPCKVIAMEQPHIRARSIDLTLDDEIEGLAQVIAGDLCATWSEPTIAYRGRHRWAQTFEPLRLDAPAASAIPVHDGGTYLIAGGLGLLGLAIAEYMARNSRVRLALVSRKGLPPRARWDSWIAEYGDKDATALAIERVRKMERSGTEVLVLAADMADEIRMRAVISEVEARFGPLHGVVHAAGAEVRLCPIHALNREDCEAQFRAKLQGLQVLERVLRDRHLDFVLVNSSLASLMGVMDFASYTASHLYMDAFVSQQQKENGTQWKYVNWDHWVADEGRGASGPFFLTPGEATDLLGRFLSAGNASQLVVSTGNLQARIDQVIQREPLSGDEAPAPEADTAPSSHPRPELSVPYAEPRTQAEKLLAEIWASLLGIERVGIHDNFFELGGDSVLSIQITAKANQAGLRFTPRQAFEHQTVAALAAVSGAANAVVNGTPAVQEVLPPVGPAQTGDVSASDLAEIERQLGLRTTEAG